MPKSSDPARFGLTGLTGDAWRDRIAALGTEQGFHEPLGPAHQAVFLDQGDTLIVSFESEDGLQSLSDHATPIAFDVAQQTGWSALTVLCRGNTWFRDEAVFDFFDQLREDGFLSEFNRVLFFGAGPGGYAAGAFSAACEGAHVLMVQPQATLNPTFAGWDERFRELRMLDFTSRYGYAPAMTAKAASVHIILDPRVAPDAMHAALFATHGATLHTMPFMGETLIQDLVRMRAVPFLAHSAVHNRLTAKNFTKLARLRRKYVPYLRRLLAHLEKEDRWELAALLCRHQMSLRDAPYFERRLKVAENNLH